MNPSPPASPDAEHTVTDRNYAAMTRTAYRRYVRPAATRAADTFQKYVQPTAKRMVVTAYGRYVRPAAVRAATAAYQKYVATPTTTSPARPTDAERAAMAAAESAAAYQKYAPSPAPPANPTGGSQVAPPVETANGTEKASPIKWSPAVGDVTE
ncbi:MAG: hypothetical protein ACRDRX_23925 [Pseudonocardiaceae bacterium]